jgi:hypothetical protein
MKLTLAQSTIAQDKHRFRVINIGRRGGKTTLAVEEIKGKAVYKEVRIAYIAPTYQQARDIAWQMLLKELQPIIVKLNESRLELEVRNLKGSTSLIQLRGWESIETLRGQAFDLLVIDEVAMMRNFWVNWQEVLRPTLTDTKGEVIFISTPKGFNHFYDLFNLENEDNDFKSFHFTSYDNPFLPKEEIDKARKELTEDRFAQEYCLTGRTKIKIPSLIGKTKYKFLKNLKIGDEILSDKGICKIKDIGQTGKKELYQVISETGDSIIGTREHKIYDGYKKEELSKTKTLFKPYLRHYDKKYAKFRLLGYIAGDGNLTKRLSSSGRHYWQVQFYAKYLEDIQKINEDLEIVFGKKFKVSQKNGKYKIYQIQLGGKEAKTFKKWGACEGNKTLKVHKIPKSILATSQNRKIEFISALMGAEGSNIFEQKRGKLPNCITISMKNPEFLNEVNKLFNELKIETSYKLKGKYATIYILSKRDNLIKFFTKIGYRYCNYKEKNLFYWSNYLKAFKGRFNEWIQKKDDGIILKVWKSFVLRQKTDVYNLTVDSSDHSFILENGLKVYNCADFRKTEGLVYKEFNRDEHLFDEPGFEGERFNISKVLGGVDFGFHAPCAVITIKKDTDNCYWVTDEWYKTEQTDAQIADYVKALYWNECYPDPENSGGIKELKNRGVNVREVIKGKESIKNGINIVRELFKQHRLFISNSCKNLIWELETYSYPDKKDAKNEEENPIKENDHALDALRYALMMENTIIKKSASTYYPPNAGFQKNYK